MDFENTLKITLHWLLFSSDYKMEDICIKNESECGYFML